MKANIHLPKRSSIASLFMVMLGLALSFSNARGQSGIQLTDHSLEYLFGEQIFFSADFESQSKLVDGHIVIQIEGIEDIFSFKANLGNEGQFSVEVPLNEDFSVPAFRNVGYWYLVANQFGEIFESQRFHFAYNDNRFNWQTIGNEHFSVHWYSGESAFGEAILASAERGIGSTQAILPLAGPTGIDIFVYESADVLQETMRLAEYAWAAGHNDLAQGQIFLSISPKPFDSLEIERQVPHEIAHLMLFQNLGAAAYSQLPKWLDEGIATKAEHYSDPLQDQLLELAYTNKSIPSLFSLCETFPKDQNLARIAYAISDSFVDYLRQEYRVVGIGAIVDSYASSDDCMFALNDLLGKNLLELERDWQTARFEKESGVLLFVENLSPLWIAALIVIVLTLMIRRGKVNEQ